MRMSGDSPRENLGVEASGETVDEEFDGLTSGPGWLEYVRERGRKIGAVGLGALAFTGGAYLADNLSFPAFGETPAAMAAGLDTTTGPTSTVETTTTQASNNTCNPADPAVEFDYVRTNVLPLGREIISDYRHTKTSHKKKRRKQGELYGASYYPVTELDIARPARWEKTGRKGTYYIIAQFYGRVIAKNMVAVEVQENSGQIKPGGQGVLNSPYDYISRKTTNDGPEQAWGLHWNIMYDHLPYAKCGVRDSKTASGDQSSYKNSLSENFFDGTLNQAEGVLKRMEQHKPLVRQKNLAK